MYNSVIDVMDHRELITCFRGWVLIYSLFISGIVLTKYMSINNIFTMRMFFYQRLPK